MVRKGMYFSVLCHKQVGSGNRWIQIRIGNTSGKDAKRRYLVTDGSPKTRVSHSIRAWSSKGYVATESPRATSNEQLGQQAHAHSWGRIVNSWGTLPVWSAKEPLSVLMGLVACLEEGGAAPRLSSELVDWNPDSWPAHSTRRHQDLTTRTYGKHCCG